MPGPQASGVSHAAVGANVVATSDASPREASGKSPIEVNRFVGFTPSLHFVECFQLKSVAVSHHRGWLKPSQPVGQRRGQSIASQVHHKAKRIGAVERQFIEGFITVLNREVDQIAQVFIFRLLCVQRRRHPVRLRGDRCINGYAAALRGGVCKDASAGKCDAHFGLRGLSLEGLAACG